MENLLLIALKEYGEKEIIGKQNNQTIVDYAGEAGFHWINDDETPWCSIFMNLIVQRRGWIPTNKANARSWLHWRHPIMSPELGDIAVFKRGNSDWQGHVALFIRADNELIYVLGGNQSNQVKISAYKKSDLLGFRRYN